MLHLSPNARKTHNPDGAIVLDIRQGRMFTFNTTGSRILQMLEVGAEEKEIAPMLVREFSADPETAESDTAEFLDLLRQHALLKASALGRPERGCV
jgi:hypothetical protein